MLDESGLFIGTIWLVISFLRAYRVHAVFFLSFANPVVQIKFFTKSILSYRYRGSFGATSALCDSSLLTSDADDKIYAKS